MLTGQPCTDWRHSKQARLELNKFMIQGIYCMDTSTEISQVKPDAQLLLYGGVALKYHRQLRVMVHAPLVASKVLISLLKLKTSSASIYNVLQQPWLTTCIATVETCCCACVVLGRSPASSSGTISAT